MIGLIFLSALGVIVLLGGVFNLKQDLKNITLFGLAFIFVLNLFDWGANIRYYNDMMYVDNFAVAFTEIIILFALLIFLLTDLHISSNNQNIGEFFAILLFTLLGAQIMVSYSNLVMLFIGIEILSISLYIMAGSNKSNAGSNEAALKYFLMGSFASAFLLLGIALIYGATGSLHLQGIANYIDSNAGNLSMLCIVGILMMMVGLAFKASAAPFHFWAPDVYEGSPTLITAFMATVVKTAAIAAFLRLFYHCFSSINLEWNIVLSLIAILTMTIGNLTALYQKNFKRLLAYSGISHAGYLLIGIITLTDESANAVFYYAMAYSLSTIMAFAILLVLSNGSDDTSIESFNGLAKKNPVMAFAMTIALLSLAGIPPLAGFFGKYYLFVLAIKSQYWLLAGIAILNSLIGIYYYFYIIIVMYLKESTDQTPLQPSATVYFGVAFCAVITILIGVFPEMLMKIL